MTTTIVIPTVGRPTMYTLLSQVRRQRGGEVPIVLVDDRADRADDHAPLLSEPGGDVTVVQSGGRGPAAARNLGWRTATTPWISFVDDDVEPDEHWLEGLNRDLGAAGSDVVGSQGRVRVPLPVDRKPTDWERTTAGLEHARWITADMSYRRGPLAAVGGFDERFPRAFREDADLALRIVSNGGRLVRGSRSIVHPVRPTDSWTSVRVQAGNADDFLMRRLHGRDWRRRAEAPPGRRLRHAAVTATALSTPLLVAAGHRRTALLAGLGWLAGTVDFAAARVRPGPADPAEITRMAATSVVIPMVATWHSARGFARHRRAAAWKGLPDLVLFDRDGTLVHDVPYNGDPAQVVPVDNALDTLDRLRSRGVRVGVVTNQSGVGSGRLTRAAVDAVNSRVEDMLGPFDVWQVCPHGRDDGCACRKPEPGMVKAACSGLDVNPARCIVVGDIGSDVLAAQAAGANGILVPTPHEVETVAAVEPDLTAAADRILRGAW